MAVRKAQLFSLIALMMSVFFIILFSGLSRVPLDKDVDTVEGQVLSLNDIVLDFTTLLEGAAETSALQILNFSVDHLNGSNYFPSFPEFFNSCFLTGTFYDYNDSVQKVCSSYGKNVSFPEQAAQVLSLTGGVYNLDIQTTYLSHSLSLHDAYSLEINESVLLDIRLNSKTKNIAWNRKVDFSQQVDFIGITDPASIGTNYTRTIRPKPGERTFTRVGFAGDPSIVADYVDNTYYFIDQTGPSFFERMQGNKTETFDLVDSNSFGLATFIPAYNQSGDSLYVSSISFIDHHYDWGAHPDSTLLRFFNSSSGVNRNITLYRNYVIQGMGFNESQLELVNGNCDASGCLYP
ncbi:MAG: hypothetical protein KC535_04085 [Nanoarchaeota archaeon]|nr:hypothetical protein [Nanoarchaeota archaeon]